MSGKGTAGRKIKLESGYSKVEIKEGKKGREHNAGKENVLLLLR